MQRIAVKELIDLANPEANLALHGGEEIRVPEVGRVFVVGNVKKPGAFRVEDSSDTTVMKLLALAEGLAPYASKEAYIYRRSDGGGSKHEIPIALQQIMLRKSPDVPLQTNDILYIPDNKGRRTGLQLLERIAAFTAATASGAIVLGAAR